MFKMLVEIYEELENIDDQYTDELWFEYVDQKDFSFNFKVHDWLREVEKQEKSGNHPKMARSQVQSPFLPGYQKDHQKKKGQFLRS